MATKTKEYFKRMLEVEKQAFDKFRKLHDEYALNPELFQKQFNDEGEKMVEVIKEWENKLCMQSEKGGYASFTNKLSENFWKEVRQMFPEIDNVGIIIESSTSNNTSKTEEELFKIKKIDLN